LSQEEFAPGATSHQVVVIGAGVAGLAAATEVARLGLTTALFDDGLLGGLVTNVGALQGSPDIDGQAGADLVTALLGEALEAGVDYQMGEVTELSAGENVWSFPGHEVSAPQVILATGAALRRMNVSGEDSLMGRGVSQCAFCDGGLYRGKNVVVVGGGDSAFQEGLHLADICANVTMVLRGRQPRARSEFVAQAEGRANMRLRLGAEVREIIGDDGVDAIRLYDQGAGAEETLPIDAVFPFVGVAPQTTLAPVDARRDENGGLIVDADMRTDQTGLYAVGAARSGYGGQITHALADATAAAQAVARAAY
jgi:thioredoxin reductase (NADPH)